MVESQALPVGDSDECGPPRGCSEPMVPSLAQVHLASLCRRQPLFEGNFWPRKRLGGGCNDMCDATRGLTALDLGSLNIS